MILHEPFIIGARLLPALQIGDATLSLASASWAEHRDGDSGRRVAFGFYLDTPEFEYFDDNMHSGCRGPMLVSAFENFLGFLEAAIESYDFEIRRPGCKGENTDLFPRHVVEWAYDNRYAVEEARLVICDEEGFPIDHLIGGGR